MAPAPEYVRRLRTRSKLAWQNRQHFDAVYRDLYRYVIPYRRSGDEARPGSSQPQDLFDATAVEAAFRFAGRMQQSATPPFQRNFQIVAGPSYGPPGSSERKQIDEQLGNLSEAVQAAIDASGYHVATPEMYVEYFCGTGALLMLQGDERQPIRCLSVPCGELALEQGPFSDIVGRYWKRKYRAWQLPEMWPNGRFNDELADRIKNEADAEIEICQSSVWDPERRLWLQTVYPEKGTGDGEGHSIADDWSRESPFITPRFYCVPGESMGRGPGMLALPSIKTLNKARELDLHAAAFALYGVWTAKDDGVFNAKTARFQPAAIWTVASNAAGGMGPTLQKLDVPGKYDLSRFITEDEREQINRMTFASRLPPSQGAVRSPTEIMERVRELDMDLGGVYARVAHELIFPTVRRAVDILERMKILQGPVVLDMFNHQVKVTSPIINSQRMETAKRKVDYMQTVAALFGPSSLPLAVRVSKAIPSLARDMGVDEDEIPTPQEAQDIENRIIEQAAAMRAKDQADAAPPPEPPNVNGAAA